MIGADWPFTSLRDGLVPAGACVGLVLFYYVSVWWLVGRDPKRAHIVAKYEPPGALSPPAIRYLRKNAFDHKALVSAVLDIAARGCAKISAEYGVFVVSRAAKDLGTLPREEQAFAGRLLKDEFTDFSEANAEHIRSCAETLKKAVREEVERRFLRTNGEFVVVGAAISAIAILLILKLTPGGVDLLRWVVLSVVMGALALLLNAGTTVKRLDESAQTRSSPISSVLVAAGLMVGSISWISIQKLSWALASIGVIVGINLVFQALLKAPTNSGRQLLDEVEGFREFLRAVELDKFKTLYPGKSVPGTIDRFFPYAFALDLGHEWNERFGAAVKDAMRVTDREGGQGLDLADALSVATTVALGAGAASFSARR